MSFIFECNVSVTYMDFNDQVKVFKFKEYDKPEAYPRIMSTVNVIHECSYVMDINIKPNKSKRMTEYPFSLELIDKGSVVFH